MSFIFDPIRKKNVPATREELVRQHVISVLTQIKNVPPHLIEVEFSLSLISPHNKDRVDLIVTDLKNGLDHPWLLVECKAPEQYTFELLEAQLNRYLRVLTPKYILLALGNQTKIFALSELGKYEPIDDFPNYQ